MKLELVRTSEPDGMWYKILRDGFTLKAWMIVKGMENTTHIEAEVYFDKLVETVKSYKFEVIKSIEI